MTSQGIGAPFGPGETIMGYQACEVHGGCYIDMCIRLGDAAAGEVTVESKDWTIVEAPIRGDAGCFELCLNVMKGEDLDIADVTLF